MTLSINYAGIGDEAADDLDNQLNAITELGWGSIELRTVDKTAVADLDDEAFASVAATVAARGIRVAAVSSAIGNWSRSITSDFAEDVAELERLAPRCRKLGTRYIRVMSYPNSGLDKAEWRRRVLQRMGELASRAHDLGLVLLHENCAGWAACDATRALELMSVIDSPALRLLFDIGNGLAHGYDAYRMLTEVVDHVAHVHVKDAIPGPTYTLPGDGDSRVADCLRLLLDKGFTGTWSLEPHVGFRPHAAFADKDRYAGFLDCGRALDELTRGKVAPAGGPWRPVPGGLMRRQEG